MSKETKIIEIEHQFSDEEIAELGKEVAKLHGEKLNLEISKKNATSRYKTDIDAKTEEIDSVALKIRQGYKIEEQECTWEHDPETDEIIYYSLSGEEVKREPAPKKFDQDTLFARQEAEWEWEELAWNDWKASLEYEGENLEYRILFSNGIYNVQCDLVGDSIEEPIHYIFDNYDNIDEAKLAAYKHYHNDILREDDPEVNEEESEEEPEEVSL